MGWSPRLNTICAACGRPRELVGHVCVNPRSRRRGVKFKVSFGTCAKCKRKYTGDPVTHVCAPRSDFKKRRKQFEQEQREKARKARPKHDYVTCPDADCKRSLCVAYKTGWKGGDEEGYARGWQQGYDTGFPDGIDACPRDHK